MRAIHSHRFQRSRLDSTQHRHYHIKIPSYLHSSVIMSWAATNTFCGRPYAINNPNETIQTIFYASHLSNTAPLYIKALCSTFASLATPSRRGSSSIFNVVTFSFQLCYDTSLRLGLPRVISSCAQKYILLSFTLWEVLSTSGKRCTTDRFSRTEVPLILSYLHSCLTHFATHTDFSPSWEPVLPRRRYNISFIRGCGPKLTDEQVSSWYLVRELEFQPSYTFIYDTI